AQATIQQEQPKVPDLDPNWNTPFNQYQTKGKLNPADIPATIQFDKKHTLFFTPETSDEDIKKLCEKLPLKEVADVIWKFENYRKGDTIPSPVSKGISFMVPRLMFEAPYSGAAQGGLLFADPDTIFAAFDWNIGEYVESRLTESEFNIGETGKGYFIDIDGNRLQYTAAEKDQFLPHFSDAEIWTPASLCYWLDKRLKQEDIPQPQMLEWLRRNIEYLTDTRKLPLNSLMVAKYALLHKLLSKITNARQQAKNNSFSLFEREVRKTLDFKTGFSFSAGMYDHLPMYRGAYKFKKHYLGSAKIPDDFNNEELECAKAIDEEPEVEFWLRNVDRQSLSFRLPTSTDWFYPDFLAQLCDSRILVVEYKGENLVSNNDTKEKANIGEIWARLSKGKALFLLATIKKGGKSLAGQIKEKIEG
ncbi:MAG: hypothetical protein LBG26_01275, partial [Treponema sp.]|nr:hypothetical protein [Treponema sp.]